MAFLQHSIYKAFKEWMWFPPTLKILWRQKKFKFGGNLAGTRQKSTVVHAKLPVFYLLLEYYVQIILKPCFNDFFQSSSVIKYFHKKQVTCVFISISNIYICTVQI